MGRVFYTRLKTTIPIRNYTLHLLKSHGQINCSN